MRISKTGRACLDWKTRDDQSLWAKIQIGGQPGVVALIVDDHGGVSATAIVELFQSNTLATVEDAQTAVENWLSELGTKS